MSEEIKELTKDEERFVELILQLTVASVTEEGIYHKDNYPTFNQELYDELQCLCCDFFITSQGRCNWTNMDKMVKLIPELIKIGPGEQDSFGWLTGVLYITLEGLPGRKLEFVYG